jgi:transposase-like protein
MVIENKIKDLFSKLSSDKQSALIDDLLLSKELRHSVLDEVKDEVRKKKNRKPCPYCKSTKVYKRGKQSGTQMYQCRDCKKWYSETTGTTLFSIKHKNKWEAYIDCMERGLSLQAISKELNISHQTSFDWRHKVLTALDKYTPEKLSSEIECDELELPINQKGVQNLTRKSRKRGTDFKRNKGKSEVTVVQIVTAVEREGARLLKAVESKRLTKAEIGKVLNNKIVDQSILITDKHPSYKAYMKDHEQIKHKTLLAKDHVDKIDKSINLQKVNNVHSQLRKFLRPYNGVSSKYVQNYLNWFAYSNEIRNTKTTIKNWLLTILLSDDTMKLYEQFKQNAVNIRL